MKYIELIKKYDNSFKEYEVECVYFLIEEIENISRSQLLYKLNNEIDEKIYPILVKKIEEYAIFQNPVQYIMSCAYFYGNKYYVNKNVLIPRFDTEVVCEKAIEKIKEKYNGKFIKIVDVGCGSGCIGITLFKNLRNISVDAIDISKDAIEVAKTNSINLNVNINFINNDLLSNLNFKYDVIISNPPYINDNEYVMDLVRKNEPNLALFSSDNGLHHYKRIVDESLTTLNDNGTIIFEIPDNKCDEIKKYASMYYNNISIYKDYNKQRRVMIIENKEN